MTGTADTAGTVGTEHTHPRTTHTHPHHHRVQQPSGKPGAFYWHTHEHLHELLTHTHALDVVQEYDFHASQPHSHEHARDARRFMHLTATYF